MRNKRWTPLALLLLGGCSLIMEGTSQEVSFTSEPVGAVFTVAGQTGVTPAKFQVPKGPYEITFEKEGYEKRTLKLDTQTSLWFYADFLVSFVAIGVDLLTGAWRTFEVTELNAVLLALPDTPVDRRVLLTSVPADAEILVDGAVRGRTPMNTTLSWLPLEKEKSVTFRHAEFKDRTLILIPDGEVLHADLEPIPVRTRVSFRSAPTGAEVFLEGRSIGRTPVAVEVEWLPDTPPKKVELELDGYERTAVVLQPKAPEIQLDLKEKVEDLVLELIVTPPGTLVGVDGGAPKLATKSIQLPWSPSTVDHLLSFTHPGYSSRNIKITRETRKAPLEVRLLPILGEDR